MSILTPSVGSASSAYVTTVALAQPPARVNEDNAKRSALTNAVNAGTRQAEQNSGSGERTRASYGSQRSTDAASKKSEDKRGGNNHRRNIHEVA